MPEGREILFPTPGFKPHVGCALAPGPGQRGGLAGGPAMPAFEKPSLPRGPGRVKLSENPPETALKAWH